MIYNESQEQLTSTTKEYPVKKSTFYILIIMSGSSTSHDVSIHCTPTNQGTQQYFTHQWERLTLCVPLIAGTSITFTGAVGDSIIVNYVWF